jgi:NADH dehydrogenase
MRPLVAGNIVLEATGRPRKPFHHVDKGIMAMIGRNAAVAEVGLQRRHLHGVIAFVTWLGVHLALLTNMRAKIEALIEWGWDYFATTRSNPILDRVEQANIDWTSGQEDVITPVGESVRRAS